MNNQIEEYPYELKQVDVRLKLVDAQPIKTRYPVHSPENAIKALNDMMLDLAREYFCVINLNSECKPLHYHLVSVGSIEKAIFDPAAVFRSAILSNATQVILIHNHPSGLPLPSKLDYKLTERIGGCGQIMGIPLVDHIIFSSIEGQYYSFRQCRPDLLKEMPDSRFLEQFTLEHQLNEEAEL